MPSHVETARLVMRPPSAADAHAIFERYASDPEVARYLAWPRHVTIDETFAFLRFSDAEWARWPCGPLLIFSRSDGTLLGSTGLSFDTPDQAATGYALARDAWGRGYATEALTSMIELARTLPLRRFYAICHVDNRASWRVLEKCGFRREKTLERAAVFPNLSPDPQDIFVYTFDMGGAATGPERRQTEL